MTETMQNEIKERYGQAAKLAGEGKKSSCCGSGKKAVELGSTDPICNDLYNGDEAGQIPEEALLASFGCGNPTALIELREGETVLDLGSGGGIDVLLSARRVGPTGKAYGLDMTREMLDLANANKAKAGVSNVEFLEGSIEKVPLPDASVDVLISNCVINLAQDKDKVLKEAFRVLKPGGRFAVSDMVLRGALEPGVRESVNLWTGCVSGSLVAEDYKAKLTATGFKDVSLEATREYSEQDAKDMAGSSGCCGGPSPEAVAALAGNLMSAFIRATKPA